jgi:hypothetical protein
MLRIAFVYDFEYLFVSLFDISNFFKHFFKLFHIRLLVYIWSFYTLSLSIPVIPAIHGFLGLNQMGADFSMVINDYALLWVQTFVYLGLAAIIFLKKRKLSYNVQ